MAGVSRAAAVAFAALGYVAAASAIPIDYAGSLTRDVTAFGTVSEGWRPIDTRENTGDLAGGEWWRFAGTAGERITLTVNRLVRDLDPALIVYRGLFTDSDEIVAPLGTSAFQINQAAGQVLFGICANFAGRPLTSACRDPAVAFADDTIDPFAGLETGTLRDPQIVDFVLPDSGDYSVLVWSAQSVNRFAPVTPQTNFGPYPYQITLGTPPSGPRDPVSAAEPSPLVLAGVGVAVFSLARAGRRDAARLAPGAA